MNTFKIKNIFTQEQKSFGRFRPGESIRSLKKRYLDLTEENTVNNINGVIVPEDFILQENDDVLLIIVPQGGSVKNTLLGVLALATGGLTASMLGLRTGSWLYAGVQSIVGGALSKKWIAPPQVASRNSVEQDPTNYFINSQQNEYRINQKIPSVLGFVRYAPPKAALDYSEIMGNDYFFRCLFCPGYGRLDISELKIGDTDITSYTNYQSEIIEKKGLSGQPALTIYVNDVSETPEDSLFLYGETTERQIGEVDEFGIDLFFPRGLVNLSSGSKAPHSVSFVIRMRETGTETWYAPELFMTAGGEVISFESEETEGITNNHTYYTITDSTNSACRKSIKIKGLDNTKSYDLQFYRSTQESEDINISDEMRLGALRTIIYPESDIVPDDFAYIALKIKATDQLSGALDTLTCLVKSYVNVWNGSTWSEQISNNPAWLAIHVLRGPANRQPADLSVIDLTAFKNWADWCDSNGYTFNAVIDSEVAVNELLHDIASAGRASIFIREGKWTVVQDIPQSIPKYLISTRNILKDSYNFSKTFKKQVQCLRIKFANEDNKEDEYPVCIDGYGIPGTPGYSAGNTYPTEIEDMTVKGVTNPDQIYKLGRFWLNSEILRPFIHEWEMDTEYYNLNKGDKVLFSHDVMQQDISRSRIKEVIMDGSNATGIVVDDECPMVLGESYIITYMNSDKTITEQIPVVTNPENFYSLVFSSPFSENIPEAGNYFIFGKNKVRELLITEIEALDQRNSKITAVDYNSAVYDLGSTPEYFSNITVQDKILNKIPPVPVIDSIVSDERVLVKKGNALISRIAISLKQSSDSGIQPESYQAQYRLVGAVNWENVPATNASDRIVYISDVEDGSQYQIRLRSIYQSRSSDWTSSVIHTVVGKTNPPKDVTGFTAVIEGEYIKFSWNKNTELDVAGYKLFKDGIEIAFIDSDNYNYKFKGVGTFTFGIKAIDVIKLESENLVTIPITVQSPKTPVISPRVERNQVYLDWHDCSRTFPIRTYKVRKDGEDWETAQILNDNIGAVTLFNTSEGTPGIRTYRIKAVDTSGNESEEGVISSYVGDALGFKLFLNNNKTDFSDCTLHNAILDNDGSVVLPVNTAETIQEHFENNEWNSPQAQIDDGYPFFIQPAYEQSGYVEFSFDAGTTIDEAQIITELDPYFIDSPQIDIRTSVSSDNVNFTDYETSEAYVKESFRYVKIRVTVTADPDTEITKIKQINTVIKLEETTEKGIAEINSHGQTVIFTKEFADVENLKITVVNSSVPLIISGNNCIGEVSPTGFDVYIWDRLGNSIDDSGFLGAKPVKISWEAVGK